VKVIVEWLGRRQVFNSLPELSERVRQLITSRGGIWEPRDTAALERLGELDGFASLNGQADEARRIANKMKLFVPAAPVRPRSPFDDAIAAAEAKLEQVTKDLNDALAQREAVGAENRELIRKAERGTENDYEKQRAYVAVRERAELREREATADFLASDEAWLRAKSRHTALVLSRDRWWAETQYQQTCSRGAE
jgi:hypothetical protein